MIFKLNALAFAEFTPFAQFNLAIDFDAAFGDRMLGRRTALAKSGSLEEFEEFNKFAVRREVKVSHY